METEIDLTIGLMKRDLERSGNKLKRCPMGELEKLHCPRGWKMNCPF